jgi:hypothetical protein
MANKLLKYEAYKKYLQSLYLTSNEYNKKIIEYILKYKI